MRVCTGTFPLNTKIKFILANESSFIVFYAFSIIFYVFFFPATRQAQRKSTS